MSPGMQKEFAVYDQYQGFVVYFLVYLMASFFLMILLMVSSLIAADSFGVKKSIKRWKRCSIHPPQTENCL
jgi:hypothetical protein